jgi:cyclopropane-fatty-acyl-phospholipid synthase
VYTGDITSFDLPEEDHGTFDRVISIEMFEHMKNYGKLLKKISAWLVPQGKLFGKVSIAGVHAFYAPFDSAHLQSCIHAVSL